MLLHSFPNLRRSLWTCWIILEIFSSLPFDKFSPTPILLPWVCSPLLGVLSTTFYLSKDSAISESFPEYLFIGVLAKVNIFLINKTWLAWLLNVLSLKMRVSTEMFELQKFSFFLLFLSPFLTGDSNQICSLSSI